MKFKKFNEIKKYDAFWGKLKRTMEIAFSENVNSKKATTEQTVVNTLRNILIYLKKKKTSNNAMIYNMYSFLMLQCYSIQNILSCSYMRVFFLIIYPYLFCEINELHRFLNKRIKSLKFWSKSYHVI